MPQPAILFSSFFHDSSALRRYYSHLVMCVAGEEPVQRRIQVGPRLLKRGWRHQSTGMRALYSSAAVALWVIGAPWLLLGSLSIMFRLRRLDTLEAS